ncbi:glycosyltransferase [Kutzneria buriramensis]|uniref:glycosyltransferase n=1 Tax=Kutzneria buriramensis TaxID=1045776 RepID=UPI000E234FEE|nr:glycosyltransferase [Kutzneria buriramensis]
MRIVFSCRPAYGHLLPLLPLASAARDVGHEVVFGTGEAMLDTVRGLGFAAHRVGIAVGEAEAEAVRRHGQDADFATLGVTMFGDILPHATHDDLRRLLPGLKPDLVVYEQSDVGAAKAAREASVPVVSHVIGRSMPPQILAAAAARMAWLWEDGPAPADAMMGDTVIDLWPDAVRDPVVAALPTVLRMRPTPFDLDVLLPAVVTASRRLVYLTLGTVAFGATSVLRAAIEGLSRLPVDVLVALGPGDPAVLGPLPDRVHVARFVPQAEVLRHAAFVVHHGGTGTVLGTLAAGLPQLVLPQGADQFVNAAVLSDLGAAKSLVGEEITADAVEAAARALLDDPAAWDVARRVADEIAALPSAAAVVDDLVGLTS